MILLVDNASLFCPYDIFILNKVKFQFRELVSLYPCCLQKYLIVHVYDQAELAELQLK